MHAPADQGASTLPSRRPAGVLKGGAHRPASQRVLLNVVVEAAGQAGLAYEGRRFTQVTT